MGKINNGSIALPFLFQEGTNKTDREAYFRHAASNLKLSAFVVEKDYYVSVILKIIFEVIQPQCQADTDIPFLFKGGTTLSKVYNVINRMSEDIDLSLNMKFLGEPEPESEGNSALKRRLKRLESAATNVVSNILLSELTKSLSVISDDFIVKIDPDSNQNILITYPLSLSATDYNHNNYVLPRVLLETGGRSGFDPHGIYQLHPMAMQSWGHKHDSFKVAVLDISRTFFEKLTLIHELNSWGEGGLRERQSRHIYDIHMIYLHYPEIVSDLALLDTVRVHKGKYFKRTKARWELAVPGTLNLIPTGKVYDELEIDWNKMSAMFPEQAIPFEFDKLIESIKDISSQINEHSCSDITDVATN